MDQETTTVVWETIEETDQEVLDVDTAELDQMIVEEMTERTVEVIAVMIVVTVEEIEVTVEEIEVTVEEIEKIVGTTEEMTETKDLDQILVVETKVAMKSTRITRTAIQRRRSTTIVSKALTKQQLNDCK